MSFIDERTRAAKPLDERASFALVLENAPVRIGEAVKSEALHTLDSWIRMRADWLRQNGRRLPTAEWLERQRHPRAARWEGGRNG